VDGELEADMSKQPAEEPAALAPLSIGEGTESSERAPSDAPVAAPAWVASTYFAEGLPYSIVHQLSTQIFTELGAGLGPIGLTSLYGAAWNLKFVTGPLFDRTRGLGRSIVLLEIALGAAVLFLAIPARSHAVGIAACAFGVVAILAATHDVAVDGFYMGALTKDRQASLSGLRVSAYRVAMLVGNGALLALAGVTSFALSLVVAGAILIGLALIHARTLPRKGESDRPPTAHFLDGLMSFARKPGAEIAIPFIISFRAGDAMMFAMSTPLLKSLGLDATTRGIYAGTGGTIASIAGSMIGAVVIARVGLSRALAPIAALQSLAIPLYAFMAWTHPSFAGIVAIILIEQLVAGVGTAAFIVYLTRVAAGAHKSTHFAIASAMMSVATTVFGAGSGYLAERVGFPIFFALAFVASLPGVALSTKVSTE
jgi:PAT family beta-lactamase induction signal transducer AmpG